MPKDKRNDENVANDLVAIIYSLNKLFDQINSIDRRITDMGVTQAELNAQLVSLAASLDDENKKLQGFIADVLAAFTRLEAKIAAGAPPVDLTAEAAIVSAALDKLTAQSTAIDSPDAQSKVEGV